MQMQSKMIISITHGLNKSTEELSLSKYTGVICFSFLLGAVIFTTFALHCRFNDSDKADDRSSNQCTS